MAFYVERIRHGFSKVWHSDDLSWRRDIGLLRRPVLYALKGLDLISVPFKPEGASLLMLRDKLLHSRNPYFSPAGVELLRRDTSTVDLSKLLRANLTAPHSTLTAPFKDFLSLIEKGYILEGRTARLDGEQANILPFGNEGDLYRFFAEGYCDSEYGVPGGENLAQNIWRNNIREKRVLVVPAYSTNAFVFALLGAEAVYGVDVDPVSIAWLKAIRNYFHDEEIKRSFMEFAYMEFRNFRDIFERRTGRKIKASEEPLFSMIQKAVGSGRATQPLINLKFVQAYLGSHPKSGGEIVSIRSALKEREGFDFIYIPYLFGIGHGVEDKKAIREALKDIWALANAGAIVAISPSSRSPYFDPPNLKRLLPRGKYQILGETEIPIGGYCPSATLFLRVLK